MRATSEALANVFCYKTAPSQGLRVATTQSPLGAVFI